MIQYGQMGGRRGILVLGSKSASIATTPNKFGFGRGLLVVADRVIETFLKGIPSSNAGCRKSTSKSSENRSYLESQVSQIMSSWLSR